MQRLSRIFRLSPILIAAALVASLAPGLAEFLHDHQVIATIT